MNINAIGRQSFQGILTREKLDDFRYASSYNIWDDRFEDTGSESYYSRDYYPFADETEEDIKKNIAPFEKTDYTWSPDRTYNKVNVKPALPVTKDVFVKYISNRLFYDDDKNTRDTFIKNELYDFVRENYITNKNFDKII